MHPKLQIVIDEYQSASERLQRLIQNVPGEIWTQRTDPGRWSVAECVAHLNLTSAAYIPLLHQAIGEGRSQERVLDPRYRLDPVGWLLWRTMGPPVRMRVKTAATFLPDAAAPVEELVGAFERLQSEQVKCVMEAEGLPLQKLWLRSPFDSRVKYNLYSALRILPRHQHRHLWQAEQVHENV